MHNITEVSATPLTPELELHYKNHIKQQLKAQSAVIIAHYYVPEEIQELADETGGFVGDSLEMAKFGQRHPAEKLIVCGVKFMGESAKILSPAKTVVMPTLDATCSLDLGCPAEEFQKFCKAHPDREVVVYANTSGAVKALSDWVVTSSIALDIVGYLHDQGKKILWAPDKFLGNYIQTQTQADMILWQSSCIVHEEFKATELKKLKHVYPEAAILVHPESPPAIIELADVVGSTSKLLKASQELSNDLFIVATDRGIFYKMQQASPNKKFIEAPTGGNGATCRACAHCPWMAMNDLKKLADCLSDECTNHIELPEDIILKAQVPLMRMINFKPSP